MIHAGSVGGADPGSTDRFRDRSRYRDRHFSTLHGHDRNLFLSLFLDRISVMGLIG